MTRVRHDYDTVTTRVKIFDIDNGMSENVFSHTYVSYLTNRRLQEVEEFHSKNYLLEMPKMLS